MAFRNPGANATLRPGQPIREALIEAWTALIDGAAALNELGGGESRDAEVVHQLRVTIKRLRGILQWVRPVVGRESRMELNGRLRDLARLLAEARRASVFQELLEGGRTQEPIETGVFRARFIEQLASDRESLAGLLPPSVEWSELREGVVESYSRARKRARRWRKSGDPRWAHECRKPTKHLKFALEFLAPLDERRLEKLRRRVGKLEDQLGDLNDLIDATRATDDPRGKRLRRKATKRGLKWADAVFDRSAKGFARRFRRAEKAWKTR